jgi:hypothetical protein
MRYTTNPLDELYDLAMAMKRLHPRGNRGKGYLHPDLVAWCRTLLGAYPGADGRKAQEVAYYLANLRFGGNTNNNTFRDAWHAACADLGVAPVWTDFAAVPRYAAR